MTNTTERTWEIIDQDGAGRLTKRQITLSQFRAELDERAAMAKPIIDAIRKGDIKACEAAQTAMRNKYQAKA